MSSISGHEKNHSFTIRKVTTMKEIYGIAEIQRAAWGMDDLGVVPLFEMKAVASVGTVLVAVDKTEKSIGFIYAYDQIPDIHYSHMMAVLPEWQGKSIGYSLKLFHRKIALEKGIKHIQWTVDPLLPNNAYLNFTKLGGICNKYYVNYYGDPAAEGNDLYAGLETDRFLIDWQITSDKVVRKMKDYKSDILSKDELQIRSPSINSIQNNKPITNENYLDQKDNFTVEVPSNFQDIRKTNLDLAISWRNFFREVCLYYFNLGWSVIDYHSFNKTQNFYELSKL